jgi:hypothetical protein
MKSFEMIQSGKNWIKKVKKAVGPTGHHQISECLYNETQKWQTERKGRKPFKEIITENLPNMATEMNIKIKATWRIPNWLIYLY